MEIEEIKKNLIEACVKGDASLFKSAFFSEKVKFEYGDKCNYFKFIKRMITSAHYNVEGDLYLKTSSLILPKGYTETYEFFSKNYICSRICILIKETKHSIYFNVIPF